MAGSLPGGDGSPAARDAGGPAWRVGRRTQNVPEALLPSTDRGSAAKEAALLCAW